MNNLYQINWGDLCPETFLKEFWQKKPLLIKSGFKQFDDPLDADELAGLAMEAELESRIIRHQDYKTWQVKHGPFEDFSEFGESNWTLLVQAVNNWSKQTAELIQEISLANSEQRSGSDQITSAIERIDDVVQRSASSSEELSSMAEELVSQMLQLEQSISFFKVSADSGNNTNNHSSNKIKALEDL